MDFFKSFLLDNSLAAISSFTQENSIFATDGNECVIHRINDCDYYRFSTIRPYRRLRRNEDGITTALACCQSNNVYFLSDCFSETGYVHLDVSPSSCGRDFGILIDASLTKIGNDLFIVGVFEKSAYLFDMNGKRLTRLCTADSGETITDFISPGNDIFAIGTSKGGLRMISVVDNGREFSGIVNKNHTLRMIFTDGKDIFALFGRRYIYNRIERIYHDGVFELPEPQKYFHE